MNILNPNTYGNIIGKMMILLSLLMITILYKVIMINVYGKLYNYDEYSLIRVNNRDNR